jgi:NAD+ synthase
MNQAFKQFDEAIDRLKSVASASLVPVAGGAFSAHALHIDTAAETTRIAKAVREQVQKHLSRRGGVIRLSGDVDSSVCAALCVQALGSKNVFAILTPENDSEGDSFRLARMVAERLGIEHTVEDIAPMLTAAGCYERRDAQIRRLVPQFGPGWGCKVAITNPLGEGFSRTMLIVQSPDGAQKKFRMPPDAYLGFVAATNMKQRTRKQIEYYHADRLNYAVVGTPNRLEYDQGFFVKNGDGAADVKPIAHLYKSQVYALAEHLGVPEEIRGLPPNSDTWSLAQTQQELYFSLHYREMDLCLYGLNQGVPADAVAAAAGLTVAQVERVWRDIASRRHTTAYLHEPPLLVEPVR